jgi:S-DNA-T family DNA segregation ATPase FtsK/SpoIIIE
MKENEKPLFREHIKKEIAGVFWLALGIYLLICLFSYKSGDPSINNTFNPKQIENYGGWIGSHLADLLFQGFGIPVLLVPFACLIFSWRLLKFRDIKFRAYKIGAFLLLLLTLDSLFALHISNISFFDQNFAHPGGAVGAILGGTLADYLNIAGATIFLLVFLLVAIMLTARFSLVLFLEGRLARFAEILERRREARKVRREQKAKEKGVKIDTSLVITPPVATPQPKIKTPTKKKSKKDPDEAQVTFDFIEVSGDYHTPDLSLLNHEGGEPKPIDKDSLTMNARILEKKLKDFGVEGEVVEVKPGPVVTMYEFLPAPGVKVNKIAGLSDDLTMALSAHSIRIVAPIPGRGVVGIEIPNKDRETVYLKQIIQTDEFQKSRYRLPMALGKDIFGHTVVSDLAKMPHLLVAGSTGSGKSVSINTMILSLLYRADPKDVRLIMVDPKMLELSIYEGIPHLLLPVVTNPKKAALALSWAVREMERRYRLMADKGVRNIEGYNKRIEKEEKEKAGRKLAEEVVVPTYGLDDELPEIELVEGEILEHGHLPLIVIIVDELADLMMVAGREIEESVARLAQMARASGIHLILATQRPSVDVITGLIKANFPTRISFKVFSRIDSRTILDSMGAESLLGMGDMLYLPPGTGALQRVHGAFVSEIEVQRVVDFLSKQGKPEYDKSILAPPPSSDTSGHGEEEEEDEKWDEALALIAEKKQASISMVQRHLRIGYNRAARMIEKMEQEGIIGPSDGTSRPREVFINSIEKP